MTRRNLLRYFDSEPFRPFRIKMTSGEMFEIRHPEMLFIGRTTARVFTWLSENDEEAKEHEREISILLIESIEPSQGAATSDQREDESNS